MRKKLTELIATKNWKKALAALGCVALIILIIASVSRDDAMNVSDADVAVVQRGPLTISVSESGTIQPRDQVVLKNELDDPATILFIVDEGKLVKKGELLVELDVTEAETDLVERRIRLQNSEAELVYAQENLAVVKNQALADIEQAELAFRFAVQDLEKYKDGEYPKLVKETEAKITLAEEQVGQAAERLKWSEILFKEKYLAQTQLQQDLLAEKKAQLELELARSSLDLLRDYTHQRQIDQLESDAKQTKMALERAKRLSMANIAQADARLAASRAELREDSERVKRLERELVNAKMHAPIDGMVIYASSVRDRRRNNEEPIRTGTMVDERDDIIYLPTASEFNVAVKIPEVALNKVQPGMPVEITVDALPETKITGTIKSIAQLPDAESRYLNPNLKLYETIIHVDPTSAALRNGMTCRAEMIVKRYEEVVYVPLQSVVRHDGKSVVFKRGPGSKAEIHEVQTGLDNARFVHVLAGLSEGDRVLMAPPIAPAKTPIQELPSDEETAPAVASVSTSNE